MKKTKDIQMTKQTNLKDKHKSTGWPYVSVQTWMSREKTPRWHTLCWTEESFENEVHDQPGHLSYHEGREERGSSLSCLHPHTVGQDKSYFF